MQPACPCCASPAPPAGPSAPPAREEARRRAARRRELVLRALHAAATLKARLELELASEPEPPPRDAREARLDELVLAAGAPLRPEQVRRALQGAGGGGGGPRRAAAAAAAADPALLLANVCLAALWARDSAPAARGVPCALPRYYLDMAVDGAPAGRVVVAVRADVAPRMARNFAALIAGPRGAGYRGCAVFQCWERESVITGDYELNNGRGGRAAAAAGGGAGHFAPDEAGLAATRGAVGMRREQRRHDRLGQVGSQFRIMLREMRGFSAVFGFVVEGLPLVERLARAGDSAGKPHAHILIADCGRLY